MFCSFLLFIDLFALDKLKNERIFTSIGDWLNQRFERELDQ